MLDKLIFLLAFAFFFGIGGSAGQRLYRSVGNRAETCP